METAASLAMYFQHHFFVEAKQYGHVSRSSQAEQPQFEYDQGCQSGVLR